MYLGSSSSSSQALSSANGKDVSSTFLIPFRLPVLLTFSLFSPLGATTAFFEEAKDVEELASGLRFRFPPFLLLLVRPPLWPPGRATKESLGASSSSTTGGKEISGTRQWSKGKAQAPISSLASAASSSSGSASGMSFFSNTCSRFFFFRRSLRCLLFFDEATALVVSTTTSGKSRLRPSRSLERDAIVINNFSFVRKEKFCSRKHAG
eukprot:15016.XXX_478986_479609_1 [CDS] Oithona nana genome sequencing.